MHRITIGIPFLSPIYCFYRKSQRLFVWILVAFILGCSHHVVKIDEEESGKLVQFIQDGITSKQEVIGQLGNPCEIYENGRIVIYIMVNRDGSQSEVCNCDAKNYSVLTRFVALYQLVLVFNANNIVENHSLIVNK